MMFRGSKMMPLLLLSKLWHDHHVSRDGLHYWPVLHKWSFLHYIYIHHSPCAVPSINPSGFSRPFPLYKWEPLFSLPFQRDHKFLCEIMLYTLKIYIYIHGKPVEHLLIWFNMGVRPVPVSYLLHTILSFDSLHRLTYSGWKKSCSSW